MAKKETFGFDTSAQRIQKWLDEQRELIKKQEVDWTKIGKASYELQVDTHKGWKKTLDSTVPAPIFLVLFSIMGQRYTDILIAQLGLDIVKLSAQVAEMQKMCKELKLATRSLSQD
jgi:hypothetical protein